MGVLCHWPNRASISSKSPSCCRPSHICSRRKWGARHTGDTCLPNVQSHTSHGHRKLTKQGYISSVTTNTAMTAFRHCMIKMYKKNNFYTLYIWRHLLLVYMFRCIQYTQYTLMRLFWSNKIFFLYCYVLYYFCSVCFQTAEVNYL